MFVNSSRCLVTTLIYWLLTFRIQTSCLRALTSLVCVILTCTHLRISIAEPWTSQSWSRTLSFTCTYCMNMSTCWQLAHSELLNYVFDTTQLRTLHSACTCYLKSCVSTHWLLTHPKLSKFASYLLPACQMTNLEFAIAHSSTILATHVSYWFTVITS